MWCRPSGGSTTTITNCVPLVCRWIACAFMLLGLGVAPLARATTPPPDSTGGRPADGSAVYSGRDGELDVAVPRQAEGAVRIDGVLDEPVWQHAAVLGGFSQYEPIEGIPASEATQIRIFYTPDAIYFGIEAFDREPDQVLARLGERDEVLFDDDWVRLMLDTFNDERQAYTFYVNPLGLQADALWIEGLDTDRPVPVDFNPDFIWTSDGRVTEKGWTAEVRIPYISLRFREQRVQTWGFNAAREVKRRGFKQSWAPLTQSNPSTLAQGGKLVGLEGLQPRRLIEVNPVTTARTQGTRTDAGTYDRGRIEPEVGLNARYGLTQNLVLDATMNPDFSQVEADATQLTVNERFALFFPEKRPFFLDGTEIFNTPKDLVYTRRIVDPIGGAKLTGKVGNLQVGYLGALDEGPGTVGRAGSDALFNLLRVRRDVGTGSTVGLLYTDRSAASGGAYNRVLGADARLLFGGRYAFTAQAAGSWTTPPDGVDIGLSRAIRPLLYASLERSGRHVQWRARLEDIHPDMRARSGFLRRIGDARLFGELRLYQYGTPGQRLERAGFFTRVDGFFEHDAFWRADRPYEAEIELQPSIWLRGDRYLSVILRNGYFRFRPAAYAGYAVQRTDGTVTPFPMPAPLRHMLATGLIYRMRITNTIRLGGRSFLRELPIYAEASRGIEFQANAELTLRPTHALSVELEHTYSNLQRVRTDDRFSLANITRSTVQYQFSKALLARAIVQYSLEKRAALRDPGSKQPLVVDGTLAAAQTRGRFQGQFLVSYEPSPGTIFYAGYSRLMRGGYDYRWSRMDLMEDGIFVKLSYLFRL